MVCNSIIRRFECLTAPTGTKQTCRIHIQNIHMHILKTSLRNKELSKTLVVS